MSLFRWDNGFSISVSFDIFILLNENFIFFLNSIQVVNRVVLHNQKIKKQLSGLYYVFLSSKV